jgi:hypothetical protein
VRVHARVVDIECVRVYISRTSIPAIWMVRCCQSRIGFLLDSRFPVAPDMALLWPALCCAAAGSGDVGFFFRTLLSCCLLMLAGIVAFSVTGSGCEALALPFWLDAAPPIVVWCSLRYGYEGEPFFIYRMNDNCINGMVTVRIRLSMYMAVDRSH